MKSIRLVLALGVVVALAASAVQSDKIPAFLWLTNGNMNFPDVYAGHTINEQDFADEFLQKMFTPSTKSGKPTVAVFLQEEMSLRDLTRRAQIFNSSVKGAVFAHLRNIMSTTNSKFLPSVSSPYEALVSFINVDDSDATEAKTTQNYYVIDIIDPFDKTVILSSNVDAAEKSSLPTVYIIHIPSNASPREIDDLIGKVDRELMSRGTPYGAIYTGKRSSIDRQDMPEVVVLNNIEQGRGSQLDSAAVGPRRKLQEVYYPSYYMFVNVTNCLYLYAQNVTISVLDQGSWSLPLDPMVDDTTYCANYSAELSLTYNDVDQNLKEVNFLMLFGVTQGLEAGYWLMTNFTVSYAIFNTTWFNGTYQMYPFFITETPYGFSYSCYQLPPISPLTTMDGLGNKTVNITFMGLQVQAFNITNNQFGYYNDCVGFFTIMTWAILIVLFVMVGILLFAACMFAGLQTPDRHEDAHGKALVINAME